VKIFKRIIDIAGAVTGIILFFPVMVVVAIAIRFMLGKPVLYRQCRPGYQEKPFNIYKFRTMRDATDAQRNQLPDTERLVWLGTLLRRTSLDELPEFWNVLRGEMSLVGPRPLLTRYLPYYSKLERIRFSVRPGITGWAQVNGRNEAGWDSRLGKDIWYVQNLAPLLDIKILWMTMLKVLMRKGVVVDAHSVMLDLDEERSHQRIDSE
jgi:lipopolysaccharide/colanic/teichoic acid biosynthesis glycosyltransferase